MEMEPTCRPLRKSSPKMYQPRHTRSTWRARGGGSSRRESPQRRCQRRNWAGNPGVELGRRPAPTIDLSSKRRRAGSWQFSRLPHNAPSTHAQAVQYSAGSILRTVQQCGSTLSTWRRSSSWPMRLSALRYASCTSAVQRSTERVAIWGPTHAGGQRLEKGLCLRQHGSQHSGRLQPGRVRPQRAPGRSPGQGSAPTTPWLALPCLALPYQSACSPGKTEPHSCPPAQSVRPARPTQPAHPPAQPSPGRPAPPHPPSPALPTCRLSNTSGRCSSRRER